VHCRLIGEFNAYNFLAVFAASVCLGIDAQEALTTLSNLQGAEGRFDYVVGENNIVGIVDYAHTPDALENVLQTIKQLSQSKQQIITVVGCGGDRDKTKRPIMASIACQLSSKVVLTSDNPRTESASAILNDMEKGVQKEHKKNVIVIEDRMQAIKTAVMLANDNDIVLVAGKGHEKYQDINGVKHPFDDKEILKDLLVNNS
jgi:UDP-N-acetylmuramoyl-L-alanyl-D-glutamate--2,6-diaminopimelate ligase